MARRVNTTFVIALSSVLLLLVGGFAAAYFMFVRPDPVELVREGDRYAEEGELVLAQEKYERAIGQQRDNVELLHKYIDLLRSRTVNTRLDAEKVLGNMRSATEWASMAQPNNSELRENFYEFLKQHAERFGQWKSLHQAADTHLSGQVDGDPLARKYRAIAGAAMLEPGTPDEQVEQVQKDLKLSLAKWPEDRDLLYQQARYLLIRARQLDGSGDDPEMAEARRDEAQAISSASLEVDPEDVVRQLNHLTVLLSSQIDQPEEAAALASRMEAQLLENPEPRRAVAVLAQVLPQLDREPVEDGPATASRGVMRAVRLLETAAEAHPELAQYKVMLGEMLLRAGERQQAREAFETVLADDGAKKAAPFLLNRSFEMQAARRLSDVLLAEAEELPREERQPVLDRIEKLLARVQDRLGEDSAVTHMMRGKLDMVQNRLRSAASHFDRVIKLADTPPMDALRLSGSAHQELGAWGVAADRFERLVDRYPDSATFRRTLGKLYLEGGDLNDAEEHLELLVEAQPEETANQLLMAQLRAQQGREEEAMEIYEQIDPLKHPAVLRPLVALHIRRGQRDQAKQVIENVLTRDPGNEAALQARLMLAGDGEEVKQMLTEGRSAGLDEAFIERAERILQATQARSADELLEQMGPDEDNPFNRALLETRLYMRTGEMEKARAAMARAEEIDPDDPNVLNLKLELAVADEDRELVNRLLVRIARQDLDSAQGEFYRAEVAAAFGETDEAIAHYRRALRAVPVHPESWRKLGDLLVQKREIAQAMEAYRTSLEQRPNNAAALQGMARALDARGEYQQALKRLKEAIRYDRRNSQLFEQYLLHEQRYGDKQEALSLRQQIKELRPQRMDNRRQLALLLAELDRHEEAKAEAEAVVAEEGRTEANARLLASVLRETDGPQAGLNVIDDYLRQQGDEATVEDHLLRARYLTRDGLTRDGVASYQQAIEREDAENPVATRELAAQFFRAGMFDRAVPLYRRLHEAELGNERATLQLAEALLRSGEVDEAASLIEPIEPSATSLGLEAMIARTRDEPARAEELLTRAIELSPENMQLRIQRAAVQAEQPDKLDAAVNDLRDLLRTRPMASQARRLLADLLTRSGDSSGAERELRTVLEQTPRDAAARAALLQLYLKQNRLDDARALAEQGQSFWPDQSQWSQILVQLAIQQNQPGEAVRHTARLVELVPSPDNLIAHVDLLLKTGQASQVLELLEQHAVTTEDMPVLQAMRAHALASTGSPDRASQVFSRAVERSRTPDELNTVARHMAAGLGLAPAIDRLVSTAADYPAAWLELAAARLESGDGQYDAAIERLQAMQPELSTLESPTVVDYNLLLATALQQAGQAEAAREAYENLLERSPEHGAALNNFAYLLLEDLDQPEAALPLAEKAAELSPNSAEVLDTLGWIQYQTGQINAAAETLEQSRAIRPLAVTCLHLAKVYEKQDNTLYARSRLREAIRLAQTAQDSQTLQQAQEMLQRLDASQEEDVNR
ncbi:MAG: tetratricopeptide repeat protein [Phycisphaeraceae bacterium]